MSRSRRERARLRRQRWAGVLRLVAGLSWVVLAIVFFRLPLVALLRLVAASVELDGLFDNATPGFVVRVLSEPSGGQLRINGVERGTVPLVANVICKEGQPVRLEVRKDGLAPWRQEVECREGRTLLVRARLER